MDTSHQNNIQALIIEDNNRKQGPCEGIRGRL